MPDALTLRASRVPLGIVATRIERHHFIGRRATFLGLHDDALGLATDAQLVDAGVVVLDVCALDGRLLRAWRGSLVFFRDEPGVETRSEDSLGFEALAFEEMVAQASALSVEEMSRRLERSLEGGLA